MFEVWAPYRSARVRGGLWVSGGAQWHEGAMRQGEGPTYEEPRHHEARCAVLSRPPPTPTPPDADNAEPCAGGARRIAFTRVCAVRGRSGKHDAKRAPDRTAERPQCRGRANARMPMHQSNARRPTQKRRRALASPFHAGIATLLHAVAELIRSVRFIAVAKLCIATIG